MYLYDEKRFNGKNGASFESYMYITSSKYLPDHGRYDDYRFLICNGLKTYEYKDNLNDINVRKTIQKQYNDILVAKAGIDIQTKADKLHMLLIDFDDDEPSDDAYDFIKYAVRLFSLKYNQTPIAINTHFQQSERCKHIHIIYPPSVITGNALRAFISLCCNDPIAASAPYTFPVDFDSLVRRADNQ